MKEYKIIKPTAENFLNNVEKHIKTVIILFIIVAIFAPLLVCKIHFFKFSGITADGFLSYVGTIISGAATFFAALIALCEAQRASISKERSDRIKRRNKIRPILKIDIDRRSKGKYKLKICNISNNTAKNIYVCENIKIAPYLKCGETKKVILTLDKDNKEDEFYIGESDCYEKSGDKIKWIYISYADIDDNDIGETFEIINNDFYISSDCDYN